MKRNMNFRNLIVVFLMFGMFITLTTPVWSLDREAAFRYPVRAYNDGNYRVAIRGFNQFLGEYPDDSRVPRIKFWKAEAHLQLNEYKKAYDILKTLYQNQPTFQTKQVLERLSYLAEQLDRRADVISMFSSRTLEQYPKLQNYLVKWRLDNNQPQELFSELSLIPQRNLTSTASEFLRNYSRNKTLESVEDQLYRGQWNQTIWDKMGNLPSVTRENLLTLAAKNLWKKSSYKALLRFGGEVPETWQTPEFKLYMAEAAVDDDQLGEAEKIYRDLLKQPKYRAQIHFSLGWVLYQTNRGVEARKYLEKMNWRDISEPFSAQAVRLLGDIEMDQGSPEKARNKYRTAIDISGDTSFRNQTRYWLAWSLYETGEVPKANKLFNIVSAEGDIRLTDVYQARGRTSLELGKYDEAKNNYQKALKFADSRDRQRELRYELAQTFYEQGKMKRAFDYLLKLEDQDLPDDLNTSVQMALARTALEVGEHELSWSIFRGNRQTLERKFPREYLYFAGQAALEVDQLKRASTLFEKLLETYPESTFGRAAVRMSFRVDLRRTDLSDTDQQRRLRKTIEQSPPNMRLSLLNEWGNALMEQRRYDRARSIFDEILFKGNDPSIRGQAIDRIVRMELERDRVDKAFEFVDDRWAELSVHPRSAQAVYRLLRHDYQQRNLDRLNQWADRFLTKFKESPYHGHVLFMLGEIARKDGRVGKAKSLYTRSLRNNPNDNVASRVNYRLGQLLFDDGNYKQAVKFLEDVSAESIGAISQDELQTMIAEAYVEINQFERAKATLESKSERSDFDRYLLARIHFQRGELTETENYLSEISTEERSILRAEKQFLKGKVAVRKGNKQKAEDLWYETMYLYPEWSDLDKVIFHLAELLEDQGRASEAEKLKSRLKQEFPNSEYLEDE